ncbi:hypothetical protein GCM10009414_27010 [Tatumella terrea]|uniref:hypothetical protein n=1 Tax=Tatumella terrea TaxID=419007 RepID=UPI0031E276E7
MSPRRWLVRVSSLNQQLQQLASEQRWPEMETLVREYQQLTMHCPVTDNNGDTISPGEQQVLLQAHEALTRLIADARHTTGLNVRETWQQQRVAKAYFSV